MSSQIVYVIEDEAAVRDSIAMLLRLHGFDVSVFGSAEDFLQAGPHARPGVALVDVRLPGISGLELQRQLRIAGGNLPVVIITAFGDVAMARRALRDGAVDFLEKPVDESELVAAVASALRADRRRQDDLRTHEAMVARLQRLTDREREVFERVTNGMHNREIAEEFGISQRTVEVHRARLMEKLQADRVAELFRLRFALDARNASATETTFATVR
jgi:FixJ family two-component response regulator